METKTLIQNTANVIKITNLAVGNTIKIVEEEYSSYETYFGVVLDLMNTGTQTFIELLLYKKSYGSIEPKIKIFTGEDDLTIFPAKIEEVEVFFKDTLKSLEYKVDNSKKDLQKEIDALEKVKNFVSGEMSKQLTETSFTTLTQEEYSKQLTQGE